MKPQLLFKCFLFVWLQPFSTPQRQNLAASLGVQLTVVAKNLRFSSIPFWFLVLSMTSIEVFINTSIFFVSLKRTIRLFIKIIRGPRHTRRKPTHYTRPILQTPLSDQNLKIAHAMLCFYFFIICSPIIKNKELRVNLVSISQDKDN